MKLKSIVHSHRNLFLFMALLIGNVIFFALVAYLLDMRYEENDDVIMCMIANGVYNGTPDCHLIFINAIWGSIISFLYTITSSIEWYSLSFCIIHILSITVIVYYIILNSRNNLYLTLCYILFIYMLWAVSIQSLQFTTTAGVACVAGCVLLLSRSNKFFILGALFVLISLLVRYQVTGIVGLLFFPLLVLKYKNDWKKYIRLLFVVIFLLPFYYADKLFYDSEEWQNYLEYNMLSGAIQDNYDPLVVSIEEIKQVGISQEDYKQLCSFNPDPGIITLEKLRLTHRFIKNVPFLVKMRNVQQLIKYRIPILLLIIIFISVMHSRESKFEKYLLCVWMAFFLLILTWLCIDLTLKNRVFICSIFSMVVFVMTIYNETSNPKWIYLINICLICLCIKYGYQCYKVNSARLDKISIWSEQQYPLLKKVPKESYIVGLPNIEQISPFMIKEFGYRIYPSGWATTIPLVDDVGDSFASLSNKNVYIFTSNDEYITHMVDYLYRRYQLSVSPKILEENEYYIALQLNSNL